LKENGIQQSMSRRGNCWDNAPQESFFAILKTEMDLKKYRTYEEMAFAITDYINYYNYDRPQKRLHKKTPYEVDQYLTDKTLVKYLPVIVPQSIIYL
ncbi:IS3 family transposase, partial [Anaerorhabdus furcosa]